MNVVLRCVTRPENEQIQNTYHPLEFDGSNCISPSKSNDVKPSKSISKNNHWWFTSVSKNYKTFWTTINPVSSHCTTLSITINHHHKSRQIYDKIPCLLTPPSVESWPAWWARPNSAARGWWNSASSHLTSGRRRSDQLRRRLLSASCILKKPMTWDSCK